MKYSKLLSQYIEMSGYSLAEIARRVSQNGIKVDRSYISKLRSGDVPPPSDEVTSAISNVLGVEPLELLWAATIEKSHPNVRTSLMRIDKALMKKGLELEKKYPIPDGLDEIEADQYISSIPEYDQFYVELIDSLDIVNNFVAEETETYSVGKLEKKSSDIVFIPVGKRIKLPIIGTVSAGINGLAYEEHLGDEWVDEDHIRGGRHFYLRVKGDSMNGDGIFPGDLALIKETPEIDFGDLAVVIVNGEEGTIKRVYQKDDSIILQASNPNYPPRVFTGAELQEIRIVGKVKQTIRRY